MPSITNFGLFLRQSLKHFRQTGSIAPSSRVLGREMLGCMERERAVRVLEVGAGTGVLSEMIVRQSFPGSCIDIVEINERMAEEVEKRLAALPSDLRAGRTVAIHCQDIRTFEPAAPYQSIICSLPFNNFPSEMVKELVDTMLQHLDEGGVFTYFEYLFLRSLLKRTPGRRARNLRAVDEIFRDYGDHHRAEQRMVLRNLPPALVTHLRP